MTTMDQALRNLCLGSVRFQGCAGGWSRDSFQIFHKSSEIRHLSIHNMRVKTIAEEGAALYLIEISSSTCEPLGSSLVIKDRRTLS
jgi:hypothetical protein